SSRRRHTRCYRDWSSDVCSSDLTIVSLRHVLPGMESADQPAEEMSERHDCGKNLAEKSECSFSPSHSFCRCTTFWRHNPQISPRSEERRVGKEGRHRAWTRDGMR